MKSMNLASNYLAFSSVLRPPEILSKPTPSGFDLPPRSATNRNQPFFERRHDEI
jgi:hypothetical protein